MNIPPKLGTRKFNEVKQLNLIGPSPGLCAVRGQARMWLQQFVQKILWVGQELADERGKYQQVK